MKRLDIMLLKGFLSPFLVSFSIALFVLVMQTLWLYIDDIIGKGASFLVILEFLSYLSISLIPMALPIGVLLAGVFLFGNLGENYELSSIKSAGISLMRAMMPIIIFSAVIGLISWVCSDYVIPKSNLKFLSRLHDLKRQKPTLSISEGVFNEDFYGYVIRIEKKSSDGMHIQKIQINDHSNPNSQTLILAKKGVMYVTEGGKFLVMQLEDGEMVQNPEIKSISGSQYPMLKSSFDTLTKVFSLNEFDLERTDEDLFKDNQRMKNSVQLKIEIDSLNQQKNRQIAPMINRAGIPPEKIKKTIDSNSYNAKNIDVTSLRKVEFALSQEDSTKTENCIKSYYHPDSLDHFQILKQSYSLFEKDLVSKLSYNEVLKSLRVRQTKFTYELMIKYSFALICLIFIFVGAPLGAIVRKGGYGYPLLLCILVFVSYILLNTFFKRLAESLTVNAYTGTLLPCMIIGILSLFLSWTAMRDRNFINDLKLLYRKFTLK
ncbi:MAG: LptF/LptG family permease [Saprospiraceae bacterium]